MDLQKDSMALGVDVSKRTLDCATYPVSGVWQHARDRAGIAALV